MNYQIGIYITDASFDHKTNVSSISFIEINKNYKGEKHTKTKNIFEAEYIGIKECMIHASTRFNNIIVICDSKQAIREAKKEIYRNKKWNMKIKDIQLIWLPRDFTNLADFLTKNITNPEDNKKLKTESFIDDLSRHNVMDIYVSKNDKEKMLIKWIKELNNNYDLDIKYSSLKLKENLIDLKISSIYEENQELVSLDIVKLIERNPSLINKDGLLNKVITMLSFSFY